MEESKLDTERHIKYWQRCLKTFLPTQYTSTDSSRMTLGFFILSALDLLGAGADTFAEKDRANIRNWILQCQHPNGGFCGSPNHKYPAAFYVDVGLGKQQMDPANLAATFFALLSLSFVGDFDGVERKLCLMWLKTLQREDGSFGELITQEGVVEGGRDMRYCYIATAVRWMLRGDVEGTEEEGEDINVEGLVSFLRSGQTYDGGISESSEHEAHAGYTYCAIAALSFLKRLPESAASSRSSAQVRALPGLTNLSATIRWLVSRQMGYSDEEDDDKAVEEEDPLQKQREALAGIYNDTPSVPALPLQDEDFVGFNGRCNKMVDTCYAFWVGASLDILGHDKIKLINTPAIRRFLYEQTQHRIGGFGKFPGSPPDIYHSYLGLAALATMQEQGIKPLDSPLCISIQQREKIERLRKAALIPTRTYWKHGYRFSMREDDPDFETKTASSEEPPNLLSELTEGVPQKVNEIKI